MGTKRDHDATMMITQSMILPLMAPPPAPGQRKAVNNDATMIFTPDMIVAEESMIMGRSQIERALAVIGLWHVALDKGELGTIIATSAEDIEVFAPPRRGRGR